MNILTIPAMRVYESDSEKGIFIASFFSPAIELPNRFEGRTEREAIDAALQYWVIDARSNHEPRKISLVEVERDESDEDGESVERVAGVGRGTANIGKKWMVHISKGSARVAEADIEAFKAQGYVFGKKWPKG